MSDNTNKNICGIDIGNKYIVLSWYNTQSKIAKLFEDSYGKNKIIKEGRSFGLEAFNNERKNYEDTLHFSTELFKNKGDFIPELSLSYYFPNYQSLFTTNADQNILFKIQVSDEEYSIDQYLLMILSYIKAIYQEKNLRMDSFVLCVPPKFGTNTINHIKKLLEVSSMNCEYIIPTYIATSLTYGYENDNLLNKQDVRYLLFIDMGYVITSITVVKYAKGKCKILSNSSSTKLGGRMIDKIILDEFQKEILEKNSVNIYDKFELYVKVRNSAIKAKEQLANEGVDSVPILFEGLLPNNEDYETTLCLNTLLAKNVFLSQLTELIDKAIIRATLTENDIKTLIPTLAGGSMRIPGIRNYITQHFEEKYKNKIQFNNTLNLEQNQSFGCCYYAAMKLKKWEYEVEDTVESTVTINDNITFPLKQDDYYKKIYKTEQLLEQRDREKEEILAEEQKKLELKNMQSDFEESLTTFKKRVNKKSKVTAFSNFEKDITPIEDKYNGDKDNINNLKECSTLLATKSGNFETLTMLDEKFNSIKKEIIECENLINSNDNINGIMDYQLQIENYKKVIEQYPQGKIDEKNYKFKHKEFSDIFDKLVEIYNNLNKIINQTKEQKNCDDLFHQLSNLIKKYEDLLNANINYSERDTSMEFINKAKQELSTTLSINNYFEQKTKYLEIYKKVDDEFRILQYHLGTRDIKVDIEDLYENISQRIQEYYQLLQQSNHIEDYKHFDGYIIDIKAKLNQLRHSQNYIKTKEHYEKIIKSLDAMIPRLSEAVDYYFNHLKEKKLAVILPLLTTFRYKTELIGNHCQEYSIFVTRAEDYLNEPNRTEEEFDNFITQLKHNLSQLDRWFYDSKYDATKYKTKQDQAVILKNQLVEIIKKFILPSQYRPLSQMLADASHFLNDTSEFLEHEKNHKRIPNYIRQIQYFIVSLRQIYEATIVTDADKEREKQEKTKLDKLKEEYNGLLSVLSKIVTKMSLGNDERAKENEEYLQKLYEWISKTHTKSSYEREIKTLRDYISRLEEKESARTYKREISNIKNQVFTCNDTKFSNCLAIRVYGNNNILCDSQRSIIQGYSNIIERASSCIVVNDFNKISDSFQTKIYGKQNTIFNSKVTTIVGNENVVQSGKSVEITGNENQVTDSTTVVITGEGMKNEISDCIEVLVMGSKNSISKCKRVEVNGDRNSLIENETVVNAGKDNECKNNIDLTEGSGRKIINIKNDEDGKPTIIDSETNK